MMIFSEHNQPAKEIALHYAKRLDRSTAQQIIIGALEISSKEEAEALTRFFWEMVDEAVEDEEKDNVIEGHSDLQSWLEKAMHIFTGYIKKQGFEEQWRTTSRECR